MTDADNEELDQAPQDDETEAATAREPDVVLDVPELSVDEITLEVEDLHARVSLQADVLQLLGLHVGVDAELGRVELTIKGVQAKALLEVRLDNVARIVERVMTTIDNNPDIIEQLLGAAGEALEEVGTGAGEALEEVGTGAGEAVEEVGTGAGEAVEEVGTGAGEAVGELGESAGSAIEDVGGAVGEVGQGAEDVVEDLTEGAGRAVGDVAEEAGSEPPREEAPERRRRRRADAPATRRTKGARSERGRQPEGG